MKQKTPEAFYLGQVHKLKYLINIEKPDLEERRERIKAWGFRNVFF